MLDFLKNTHTLIGSLICIILTIITLILPKYQSPALAIVDPLSVPNNKFGIHIISGSIDESSPAAELVNTNGDWGYITFLIESSQRNEGRWQEFFNDLRRRHLIPIVRLATKSNGHWARPYEKEYEAWADFLDKLNWPTKNRYVIVYNEPNHGAEWGGAVDPKNYARVLDQTISALKNKNEDFFVLNAGFDASAPQQTPNYMSEVEFLRQMNEEVPGIFDKLDGWNSHSYPNPEFIGSPDAHGRGTVRTWFWELQQLRNLGVTKNLPVFITETGWKHSAGVNFNPNFPSPETVATYYTKAFSEAWNHQRIVAVTPFLLTYQQPPFDYFSFKGHHHFHHHFHSSKNLPKVKGQPIQEHKAQLVEGEVYSSIVSGEIYNIFLKFKNIGQSIWSDQVKLTSIEGGSDLGIESIKIPSDLKIEPNQEYTFNLQVKAPTSGNFKVSLNLFEGNNQFESKPVEFTTEVKAPVILKVLTKLKWRQSPAGEYILRVSGAVGESTQKVLIDENGISEILEARHLLPDYDFEFSLEKPYYKSVTITQKLQSGENILDFGQMQPSLLKTLLTNPKEFWNLLPWSE